jgi:hypothetical protein
MKITEIEGTPEEIKGYLNKDIKANKVINRPIWSWSPKDLLKTEKHWSNNKQEWVLIEEMDMSYILNVIRIKLRENKSNIILLEQDDEFKALIAHLADKLDTGV